MSEAKPTAWARERFGDVAEDMAEAVSRAIHQAHGRALAAHLGGGLTSNDTYGVTLHVAQYEELVTECGDLPGVSIRKPRDVLGRFDLVVRDDPPVVLYPWRYATDKAIPRDRARLRPPVSDLRKSLLSLNANTLPGSADPGPGHGLILRNWKRSLPKSRRSSISWRGSAKSSPSATPATPAGASSSSAGVTSRLVNEETGQVQWRYWEELPPPGDQAAGGSPRKPVAPVGRGRQCPGRPLRRRTPGE